MAKKQRRSTQPKSATRSSSNHVPTKRKIVSGKQQHQHRHPKPKSQQPSEHRPRPTLPFEATDNVLLVGEGDFSFAYSLLMHHRDKFKYLCATCLESRAELLEKYPQAEKFVSALTNPPALPAKVTATEVSPGDLEDDDDGDENASVSEAESNASSSSFHSFGPDTPSNSPSTSIIYSIDATNLQKYKPLRTKKWNRIIFNFPHVGGKSTDVNRQVRYNQALLHAFFQSSLPLLSENGAILVTLFEGQPYELWNVRDLGRSVGLRVVRSFAFQAELYPGYAHARTCGNMRAKGASTAEASEPSGLLEDEQNDSSVVENKKSSRPGKWRGEERKARTYEFGLPEKASKSGKKKRKRQDDEESSGEE